VTSQRHLLCHNDDVISARYGNVTIFFGSMGLKALEAEVFSVATIVGEN